MQGKSLSEAQNTPYESLISEKKAGGWNGWSIQEENF